MTAPSNHSSIFKPYEDKSLIDLCQSQRDFFAMGKSKEVDFRIQTLKKLKRVVKDYEEAIIEAVQKDLNKPRFEAYASEIGVVYDEINLALKNLKSWSKPRRTSSPLTAFPSRSYIIPEPKGVCLIIGPWNYPFQLVIGPLIAALSAGNTAFVKPPEQCPHTAQLIGNMLGANFDKELICVVQGEGHQVVPQLMNLFRFDHIFFTGSIPVGKSIAQKAAEDLIPVTLELGGKSPCIIDESANLKVAARRIAFGKWLNAGQTCIAPDYLLVKREVWDLFREELIATIKSFYPQGAIDSDSYTSIVNEKRYQTLKSYLNQGELLFGGEFDDHRLRIAPTLLLFPDLKSPVMQEEIFGPILAIHLYDFDEDAKEIIAQNPNPLAFYIFSENKKAQEKWLGELSFGNGMVNNTVLQFANPSLPFGGIGDSGMGNAHGKFGFDTFSHHKAIMKSGTWLDPQQKYPPYSKLLYKLIRWLMS